MPILPVIQTGMAGVDMLTNPMFLPTDKAAGATNMVFKEGAVSTRPGIRYHNLGQRGRFQGASVYSPSRGLSHQPFADPYTAVVVVAGGCLNYNLSSEGGFSSPVLIGGNSELGCEDVHIYQAENYLIVQSPFIDTLWWEGYGDYVVSPGLDASQDTVKDCLIQSDLNRKSLPGANVDCCFQKIEYCDTTPIPMEEEDFSSHDTFDFTKHKNFLVNSAGIGIYSNGRIHQDTHQGIYVSDLIHKRGVKYTDDILLMEEQLAGSFGDPLSANSRLGQLRALETMPAVSNANGEGSLVAYYDNGVVSFNTGYTPRETRFDAESGEMRYKGWSEVRLINHLLNSVSATGRYAVGVLPRDHAFRSRFGIHLLKTTMGEEVINDEFINLLSHNVEPILDADDKSLLKGTSVGQWVEGSRLLTTVGMHEDRIYSSSSMGRGFVVWHQAYNFTAERTPRPVWEGLWSVSNDIAGIHRILDASPVGGDNMFGFIASKAADAEIVFGEINKNLHCDIVDGKPIPIEWNVTSRKVFRGYQKLNRISGGRVEIEATGRGSRVRVLVRSDVSPEWSVWREKPTSDSDTAVELHSIELGLPQKHYRSASWFQFRVEGIGHSSLRLLEIDMSEDADKMGRVITTHDVKHDEESFHIINTQPKEARWS